MSPVYYTFGPIKGQTSICGEPDFRDSTLLCGRSASGPHPDPKKGYSQPVCLYHLTAMKNLNRGTP